MADIATLGLEVDAQGYVRGVDRATASTRNLARQGSRAERQTDRLSGSFTSARRTARLLQGALAAVGIGSMTAALRRSVGAFVEFERAMTGVAKTVDAPVAVLAEMGEEIKALSERIPLAATEIAGIAEAAGQLGIQTDAILAFTETMAALGVSTNLSSQEAATALARLANIMQTPQDAFDRLGATIVELGNNLATTERELVEFGTRMAGAGEIAGLSEADVLAIGAAMSSVGIEAEAGGTAVQKALIDINTAVAQGSAEMDRFARVAGMTAEQFAQQWRADAGTAFVAFVEGLGRAGDDASTVLEELGLNNQRLVRAFLSLANAGDLLRESVGLANEAWRENSALTAEAQKFYDTLGSDLEETGNLAKNVAGEFGAMFEDDVRAAAEAFQGVLQTIRDNMSETVDLAKALALAIGVAGLAGAFKALASSALIQLIPAIRNLRDAITLLHLSLGPTGWLIAGITALTGVIYAWRRAHEGQAEELRGIGQAAGEAAQGIREMSGAQLLQRESELRSDISRARYRIEYLQGLLTTPGIDSQARTDIQESIDRTRLKGIQLGKELADIQGQIQEFYTLPPIKVTVDAREVEEASEQLVSLGAAYRAALGPGLTPFTPMGDFGIGGRDSTFSQYGRGGDEPGRPFNYAALGSGLGGLGGVLSAGGNRGVGTLFSSAGGIASGIGAIAAAAGPVGVFAGAVGIAGSAIEGLASAFGGGETATERFIRSVERAAETLRYEFEAFDINDPVERFRRTLESAMETLPPQASSRRWLEGLTPENIDARIREFLDFYEDAFFKTDQMEFVRSVLLELEKLGDAAEDAAGALGELVNIPKALPLEYLRQQAGMGNAPGGGGGLGPTPPNPPTTRPGDGPIIIEGDLLISTQATDGETLLTEVEVGLRQRKGRGGTSEFDRHYRRRE